VEHSDTYYTSFIDKLFERIAPTDAMMEDIGDASTEPPSRKTSKNFTLQRVPTKVYEPDAGPDMQAVLDRLDNVELALKQNGVGASATNFLLGQVVGALLVIVSIAVVFTLINSDAEHRWDAFLTGLLVGSAATAAGFLTFMAYAKHRAAKKTEPKKIEEP
jgi:hypothetical protein